ARFLSILGNHAYDWLLTANRAVNGLRRRFGLRYWSLAAYLKHKVKNAVNYISNFEEAVVHAARKHDVDGLVCGHIHHASVRNIDDLLYLNCGDWVESCTALVEHHDGRIELLRWADMTRELDAAAAAPELMGHTGTGG
ncbi:MAG: UDP-2,3-diacylglucosamine diphosphatase, partial [Candidatus Sedimenticola sp. 6PFRAG1]